MLLLLSGYATWHGMRDFIVGVSQTSATPSEGMSVSNDVLVIGVVVALTFLMWLALREMFGAKRKFTDRLVMFVMYAFLAVWSIGFGYGFWWSLISGEEATRTGLAGLQEDARDASSAVAARLDAVKAQLDNVVTWSDGQMTARGNQRRQLRQILRRWPRAALQRPRQRSRQRRDPARWYDSRLARTRPCRC